MRCKRCGRKLKDPQSIEAEMGPVCAAKMCGSEQTELEFPLPSERVLPKRFLGKSMMEQHKEVCRLIFKRGD